MITLWRQRAYRFLWLAQLSADLGDVLYNITIVVLIYKLTGSAIQTVSVTLIGQLPPFFLSPLAGAIVDRYPRARVMLAMNALRILVLIILLLAMFFQLWQTWHLLVVTSLLAISATFYFPARLAIVPQLVPPSLLISANSALMASLPASLAVGYLLGGELSRRFSLPVIVVVVLALFLLSSLFLWQLPSLPAPQSAENTPHESLLAQMRHGVRYVRHHPLARSLISMEIFEHIGHGMWIESLLLVFVQRVLRGTEADWGQQNGAFWVAVFFGSILSPLIANWFSRFAGKIIIFNAFFSGLMSFAYAYNSDLRLAILLTFGFGLPMALRDVAQDSLLQSAVEGTVLGRVFALREMGRKITFMLAGFGFAALAELIPLRMIYAVGGTVYLLSSLYALLTPTLRQGRIVTRILS